MSTSTNTTDLFAGTPSPFGGLSNERELVAVIPDEFRRHNNAWTRYAGTVFFRGADLRSWKWRATDAQTQKRQMACFKAAISGWDLAHEEKEALCGWMLSEMLTEVPR